MTTARFQYGQAVTLDLQTTRIKRLLQLRKYGRRMAACIGLRATRRTTNTAMRASITLPAWRY